jgi:DNA-binding NarL/FixJ family response regulator
LLTVDGASPSTAIDVVRRVKAASGGTKIVLVLPSPADREALLLDYLEAGADGFLDREATFDELTEGLRAAADGDLVVPEDDVVLALRNAARGRDAVRRGAEMIGALTEREREILDHVVDGFGNDEIARRLHISARTVASHIQNLYRKLNVHSRLQAVAVARRYGITAKDAV